MFNCFNIRLAFKILLLVLFTDDPSKEGKPHENHSGLTGRRGAMRKQKCHIIRGHRFVARFFRQPVFCSFCTEFMWWASLEFTVDKTLNSNTLIFINGKQKELLSLLFYASAENCTVLPFATKNNDFRVCFYYSAGDSRNKVISAQVGLCLQFVHKINTINFCLEALGLYRRGFQDQGL